MKKKEIYGEEIDESTGSQSEVQQMGGGDKVLNFFKFFYEKEKIGFKLKH